MLCDMCCRLVVTPLDAELAAILLPVGLFVPFDNKWVRNVYEEQTSVFATLDADGLHLFLSPTISAYSQHHGKRISAGIYFEMAVRYAEKCDGTIIQQSNIGLCIEDGITQKLLAHYPDQPLCWSSICRGFQEEILGLGEYQFSILINPPYKRESRE